MDGPPGASRQLGRDEGVVARGALGAEAAAHEAADHAHLVLRQVELPCDLVADAPEELGRRVDDERVTLPLAGGLVRLERVVEDALRPVLGLDDDVRVGKSLLDVAAPVVPRVGDERLLLQRLLGVEQRLQHFPFHIDRPDRRTRLLDRLGGDGGDGLALEVRLVREDVEVARPDHGPVTGDLAGRLQIKLFHARARVWAAQNGGVQHPR